MDELLSELVKRLKGAYGEGLVSVVLYGSAASGDYHKKHSDLNVLCVLRRAGAEELAQAGEAVAWWAKKGQTAPLILSEEEIRRGADVFPIEYLDIQQSYRLLDGADVVADIQVNMTHHRRQLEHELRSRLLRLRKRYLEAQGEVRAVERLMLESLPTFATLFRHALVAAGEAAPARKQEVFRAAAQRFGVGPEPFQSLLEAREGKRQAEAAWFAAYLEGITKIASVVDRL